MRRSGFSLLELLIALLIASIMVLGVGTFYVETVRSWRQGQIQADLRRQADLAQQELARTVRAAVGLPSGSCGPVGARASLPVQVPAGVFRDPDPLKDGGFVCFYRDPADDRFMRCRFESLALRTCSPGSLGNLLAGAPIPDPIRLTDFQRGPGGLQVQPGTGLKFTREEATAVNVNFNVATFPEGEGLPEVGPLSFATRLTVRN
jgi:prepilin-type N-terminal cleavage/methylation domain-containing protein